MNEQPTAELLHQTGEAYIALAKDPTLKMEGSKDGKTWFEVKHGHHYGRIKPRAKTPEELRVERNLALDEEYNQAFIRNEHEGILLEVFNHECASRGWRHATPLMLTEFKRNRHLEFRRKPAPRFIPWTFEDQLCGLVVELKSSDVRAVIWRQDPERAHVGLAAVTYADLLRDWTHDGQPAGKRVEGEG